jgi:hypothetical protein
MSSNCTFPRGLGDVVLRPEVVERERGRRAPLLIERHVRPRAELGVRPALGAVGVKGTELVRELSRVEYRDLSAASKPLPTSALHLSRNPLGQESRTVVHKA